MTVLLELLGVLALFCLGLRLSAFFSGVETGFYRVSFLRLSIDAHAGDDAASRILWFVRNPGDFVTTTLIGNNVANYITTLAIGLSAAVLRPESPGSWEIAATLAISPVVFVFGELVPKSIYYLSPLSLLRRDIAWFQMFYRLFLLVSFPLMALTKQIQRFGGSGSNLPRQLALGRSRLAQVLRQGHTEGLLSDVQSWLVHGLLNTAAQRVTESIIPVDRILGVPDDALRQEVLEYARRFGTPNVAIRRAGTEREWYGYVRVADIAVSKRPLRMLVRTMPRIDALCSKLDAMQQLREAGEAYGVVCSGERVLGIVSAHGLIEQLFRPPAAQGVRPASMP